MNPTLSARWLPWLAAGGGMLLIILSLNPFRFVENGQKLVIFSWVTGVQDKELDPGFHLVMPIVTSTVSFDTKEQALTWKDQGSQIGGDPTVYGSRLIALSEDGQEIRSEVTLRFQVVDPSQVYTKLGLDYVDRIAPLVRSAIALETAAFSGQDLYSTTERPVLQARIQERLNTQLQEFGISVLDLLLRDVDFSTQFIAAIEAKTIAENQLERKEFEIQEAQETAKAIVTEAQAEAGKLKAKADALQQNPQYLEVVKAGILGETLDTLITR